MFSFFIILKNVYNPYFKDFFFNKVKNWRYWTYIRFFISIKFNCYLFCVSSKVVRQRKRESEYGVLRETRFPAGGESSAGDPRDGQSDAPTGQGLLPRPAGREYSSHTH